jgi:hypothetical protein
VSWDTKQRSCSTCETKGRGVYVRGDARAAEGGGDAGGVEGDGAVHGAELGL